VAKSTVITVVAGASVGEMRTLMRMELEAVGALLAVAQDPKSLAVHSCWADAHVGEATVIVVAAALLEVLASRCVVVSGLVGERATVTLGAGALEQPGPAYRLPRGVVDAPANVAGADTCNQVRGMK